VRYLYIFLFLFIGDKIYTQSFFVKTDGVKFIIDTQPYSYIGTNYWYGGYLTFDTSNNGYQRLCEELDFLNTHGVTNLRVLFSGEGDSSYPYRISPSVQEKQGKYNETILRSFDVFLDEVSKRKMKVILALNNNWEWSGGMGQYLEWAGYTNNILPKTANWDWDNYCQYISQFYTCDSCQIWYRKWIEKIVTRKNSINHKLYINDDAIMAWQLGNEPRPMKKSAKEAYKKWVEETSRFIKVLDTNHLVSIGVEGIIGTAMDSNLFAELHLFPTIDYATIHLWPKTWQWYNGETIHSTTDTTIEKTKNYIEFHSRLCHKIKKPLVVEEFGLHRDGNSFKETTSTEYRDQYYQYIFDIGKVNKIAGYNFWGAFAFRDLRMKTDFWKKGLHYGADPPQEEQGLYGIYKSDSSTWNLIKRNSNSLNSKN
jgi:mannan endo-1,4-beta-mannosidase